MKILLTGGGTAGHFYPLIAIAEEINKIAEKENLLRPELYYMSVEPYDTKALFDNGITFQRVFSGKSRLYFSLLNFLDVFRLAFGVFKALLDMYRVYPDVVVSKGGYASIPAVFASRFFTIPLIIHDSDSAPGRTNLWAGKFAERIAISWPEAYGFFPKEKTALTGQPVRAELLVPEKHGAREFLALGNDTPVILILGGSQGAKLLNDTILAILPQIAASYQIVHQTGQAHYNEVFALAALALKDSARKDAYKPFEYLNTLALKMAAGAADLVISRAGSTIFEIAAWGKPSIIIPITETNGDHQRKNAFNYARKGAAIVIEEKNLKPSILLSEINRVMRDTVLREKMAAAARLFFEPDAAHKIAREAIKIALAHQ
ncbi:MAG: UDP-N-acetylglucosamine--N-acetylmuramyl-(pentapeptide) pyrophosphoryl-undecaprenol N-acetylglucosamine transferase [Parcubacteria group bacterium]|nr:UDP-N-acetylglucosamine--N-acetylmuramyl-(pentapeptide) pyrophosphoryl-undecaprenol N-acetylglucosamine transferase [Parcubacteria group bacterium]